MSLEFLKVNREVTSNVELLSRALGVDKQKLLGALVELWLLTNDNSNEVTPPSKVLFTLEILMLIFEYKGPPDVFSKWMTTCGFILPVGNCYRVLGAGEYDPMWEAKYTRIAHARKAAQRRWGKAHAALSVAAPGLVEAVHGTPLPVEGGSPSVSHTTQTDAQSMLNDAHAMPDDARAMPSDAGACLGNAKKKNKNKKKNIETTTTAGGELFGEGEVASAKSPPETVQRLWNEKANPALSRWKGMPPDRKRKVETLLEAHPLSQIEEALAKVNASVFCLGGGDKEWRAGPDWFVRLGTITKLLEGGYDFLNKPSSSEAPSSNTQPPTGPLSLNGGAFAAEFVKLLSELRRDKRTYLAEQLEAKVVKAEVTEGAMLLLCKDKYAVMQLEEDYRGILEGYFGQEVRIAEVDLGNAGAMPSDASALPAQELGDAHH